MILKGKRIFVVEDNTDNRVVYHIILTRAGVVSEFERWGIDTVKKLRIFQPVDLIILDLMLKRGASGYTIFDEIRQLPEFDNVPIIAVSSSDASEAIVKTRERGFSGYIAKPIDQTIFSEQLLRIIEGESIWAEM